MGIKNQFDSILLVEFSDQLSFMDRVVIENEGDWVRADFVEVFEESEFSR